MFRFNKFCEIILIIISLTIKLSSPLPLTSIENDKEGLRTKRSILDHFNSIQRNGVPTIPITFGEGNSASGGPTLGNGRGRTGSIYIPGTNLTDTFLEINETVYSTLDFKLKPEYLEGIKLSELTIKAVDGIGTQIPISLYASISTQNETQSFPNPKWQFISSRTQSINTAIISFNTTVFLTTLKSLIQNNTNPNFRLTFQLRRSCSSETENIQRCIIFHPQKSLMENYIRIDYFNQRSRKRNRLYDN